VNIGNLLKWGLVVAIIGLTALNASWIAPQPAGTLKLIAAHGAGAKDGCVALGGLKRAIADRADYVNVPVKSRAGCASADDALYYIPSRKFIVDLTGSDADAALAPFAKHNRPVDERYSFLGDGVALAAIRAKHPDSWAWSVAEARVCFESYVKLGWTGMVPGECAGKTMIVPLDQQWKIWGWPKRFAARMEAAKVRVILSGPDGSNGTLRGIEKLEQIPDIPRDFTGYLWVEDISLIGPSLRN
jgi:hypothetical protein